MLWSLTKWNHRLSTMRLVRWWLRMTVLDRFILVGLCNFMFLVYSFFTFFIWLMNYGGKALTSMTSSKSLLGSLGGSLPIGLKFLLGLLNFVSGIAVFFEVVFLIIVLALSIFFVIDIIWDFVNTRRDLMSMTTKKDIVLATRGEYVGGHPQLPHARFVYLVISGTLQNPYLGIVLPSFQPVKVKIPLMDITSAKAGKDDKFGKPGIFNFSMTSITPSIWKGERSAINIEYTSTGRKYIVELGSFLRGNDEVQMWKNYLTCTQAEADTSTKPFGEWESLPKGKTIKRKEENEESKSED